MYHQPVHHQVLECENAITRSVSFIARITIIASSVAGVALVLIMVLSVILFGVFIKLYCKLKRNKGEATINGSKGMCGDETLYT